jgi:imidazolonepropionase
VHHKPSASKSKQASKVIIIKNANQILTIKEHDLGVIEKGTIVIENGKIRTIGKSSEIRIPNSELRISINASGCVVMPGFVDCHTHLVFAGDRANEFEMRIGGKTYKEILEAGGGIMATVQQTRKASEEELYAQASKRITAMLEWGTTTVEIKSGYGLDTETELKILRVIKRLQKDDRITVMPTFLGAHSVPQGIKKEDYIREVTDKMIPAVSNQNLAKFCDVFCENFVFNASESKRILNRGKEFGLVPKIHADEIEQSGGAEVAAKVGAISAEHLLYPSPAGLAKMKEKDVTAVLLPAAALFLQSKDHPPVELMRQLGLRIALGSDYNPGTSMVYQMPIVISLACLIYRLTIAESLIGATINSAKALGLQEKVGSLEVGKQADILILDVPNYQHIPYQFGKNFVRTVIKNGVVLKNKTS